VYINNTMEKWTKFLKIGTLWNLVHYFSAELFIYDV